MASDRDVPYTMLWFVLKYLATSWVTDSEIFILEFNKNIDLINFGVKHIKLFSQTKLNSCPHSQDCEIYTKRDRFIMMQLQGKHYSKSVS